MSNVVQLPDSMVRAWRVYEETLVYMMRESGAAPELIEHVLDKMKPIYLKASTPLKFQADNVEEALARLNAWVMQQTGELLIEIAIREIQLYQLRGDR